ncbi:MAG: hypothetical protein GX605_03285 [Chloroflexi bacterium]|nr:hypothetical protein [Chloroflexota bacterium]
MADVVLAVTHHDSDGRWMSPVAEHLPAALTLYAGAVAVCSRETPPEAMRQLRSLGVLAQIDNHPGGPARLGEVRRRVLRLALESGAAHIHFCDLDRALHWATFHPEELRQVVEEMPAWDFWVLGRTPRAFASHPPDQTLTESLANTVFGMATGLTWDLLAASRGISASAARWLLAHSQEPTFGTDAEWPLLLRAAGGFRVGARECDGLSFETADVYPQEVAAAGGRDAWRLQRSQSPQVWAQRLQYAAWVAQAVVETQRRWAEGSTSGK